MKVKELVTILNVSVEEILELLENVDVDISAGVETEVEKEVEKNLAKRYGVPYPFKSAKVKQDNKKPTTTQPATKTKPETKEEETKSTPKKEQTIESEN